MTTISRRNFGKLAFGSALMMSGFGFTNVFAQTGKTAICYNVPAEWAGWGNMLQLIAKETGINVPIDNKNSGQSVSQVIAEAKNPVADAMYLGISFAINAKKAGIIEPFKGKGWQSVPDNLKDPDGHWVSIHAGTELRSSLRNFESQNEYGYKPCIKRRFQNAETLQSRNQKNSS